mmetsp:Transcript_117142/g.303913  ORF Transcript_117142/g.303913 Transcript_117142/m.303913 type:complete len:238 (-) Transcript_117142:1391-2104(-)
MLGDLVEGSPIAATARRPGCCGRRRHRRPTPCSLLPRDVGATWAAPGGAAAGAAPPNCWLRSSLQPTLCGAAKSGCCLCGTTGRDHASLEDRNGPRAAKADCGRPRPTVVLMIATHSSTAVRLQGSHHAGLRRRHALQSRGGAAAGRHGPKPRQHCCRRRRCRRHACCARHCYRDDRCCPRGRSCCYLLVPRHHGQSPHPAAAAAELQFRADAVGRRHHRREARGARSGAARCWGVL